MEDAKKRQPTLQSSRHELIICAMPLRTHLQQGQGISHQPFFWHEYCTNQSYLAKTSSYYFVAHSISSALGIALRVKSGKYNLGILFFLFSAVALLWTFAKIGMGSSPYLHLTGCASRSFNAIHGRWSITVCVERVMHHPIQSLRFGYNASNLAIPRPLSKLHFSHLRNSVEPLHGSYILPSYLGRHSLDSWILVRIQSLFRHFYRYLLRTIILLQDLRTPARLSRHFAFLRIYWWIPAHFLCSWNYQRSTIFLLWSLFYLSVWQIWRIKFLSLCSSCEVELTDE